MGDGRVYALQRAISAAYNRPCVDSRAAFADVRHREGCDMAERILRWILGVLFIAAGVPKIIGIASVAQAFDQMGYSPAFRSLIGVLETAGGIGLLFPAAAIYAAGLLVVIMIGAIWTTLRIHQSPIVPALVALLLAAVAALRVRELRHRVPRAS
jgi:putative oxidoreductase